MKELWSIQYLRGLAALAVLVFHMAEGSGGWFHVGSAGVDLFFIISGAIMWSVTEAKEQSALDFIKRRLLRVVPIYWLCTLLYFGLYRLKPNLFYHGDDHSSHLLMSLLFVPNFDIYGHNWPTLIQGWTLNIEMFFYATFALALLLPRRWQLSVITALLCSLSLAGAVLRPEAAVPQAYTSSLLLEFVAGLWIGRLTLEGRLPGARSGWLMLALGALAFMAESRLGNRDGCRLLEFGIPALLALTGALAVEAGGALPRWPWAKQLGDASYSIYLLHGLVAALIVRLPLPLFVQIGAALAITAILGRMVHARFERRVSAWLRGRPPAMLLHEVELQSRP